MAVMRTFWSGVGCSVLLLVGGFVASATAEVVPLDEEGLSQVWGRALVEFRNSHELGYDFSRMTLNADIDINANISGVQVGLYESGGLNLIEGIGLAVDIGALQLGRSDGSEAQRLVALSNPYVEFAFTDVNDDFNRRMVGMRAGFEGVTGDIGVALNSLSGSLLIDLGDGQAIDSLNDPMGGLAWDGLRCLPGVTCGASLAELGVLRAGSADGPSRDFFVSVLSAPLTFPAINGIQSNQAPPGIWLNWRDRLQGALGAMPPNASK